MSRTECYGALATLIEYPEDRELVLANLEKVESYLGKCGIDSPARPFAVYARSSTLASLQEDYVAAFDFNPVRAPYLGHHLYGDGHKRGAYLVRLKGEFVRYGFSHPGVELPDHLSVLLCFLAHLCDKGEEESRRRFIEEEVLPGVEKFCRTDEREESPWEPLFRTAELLLLADGKEVPQC